MVFSPESHSEVRVREQDNIAVQARLITLMQEQGKLPNDTLNDGPDEYARMYASTVRKMLEKRDETLDTLMGSGLLDDAADYLYKSLLSRAH